MRRMQSAQKALFTLFEPGSIAVIGSLRETWMGGYMVIKSLLRAGYDKPIYPVNPSYKKVHGIPAYHSLDDIEAGIDLAVIMINARSVPEVLKECGKKGIKSVIVISDGFAERGREGLVLQEDLLRISRQFGMRIVGPNTAGIVNAGNGVNICAYEAGYYGIKPGFISILSQTGMINPQAFPYPTLRFGISKICDLGNKCDIDESDVLEYLENDKTTQVISIYLESIRDGRRFMQVAKRVSSQKPILVLKAGKTAEGVKALESHTGSMAGDYGVFTAVCQQSGILLIDKFSELFDLPKIFASQPLPKGNRLGVITQSGAFGGIAASEAGLYGLKLATLTVQTSQRLDQIFPGLGKVPVDVGPAASTVKKFYRHYPMLVRSLMEDENVDSLLNILWIGLSSEITDWYIKAYQDLKDRLRKPVLTCVCGSSVATNDEIAEQLEAFGFPVFTELSTVIKGIGMLTRYAWFKNRP